jgi:hypothetical protein
MTHSDEIDAGAFDWRLCPVCHHPRKHHFDAGCGECTSDQMLSGRAAPCSSPTARHDESPAQP